MGKTPDIVGEKADAVFYMRGAEAPVVNVEALDITRLPQPVKAKIDELRRLQRALEKLIRACPGKARIVDCGILEALTPGEPHLSG